MGDTVRFALVSDAPGARPLLVRNFLGRERLDRLRALARRDRDRFRQEVGAVDRYVEAACHLVVRRCLDLGVASVAVGGRSVKNPFTVKPRSLWENPLLDLSLQLLQTLRFQCILGGMDLLVVDEAFTSRVDSLCLQPLGSGGAKPQRLGHCNRRQFLSSCGDVIHRDLNGAINIGRRAFGDDFARPILEDRRWEEPELGVVFPERPSPSPALWRFALEVPASREVPPPVPGAPPAGAPGADPELRTYLTRRTATRSW